MAKAVFIGSYEPILKDDGTVNAGGTVEFYEPGTAFATSKVVYDDADLTSSLGAIITLSASGIKRAFLNDNYDIIIKDSLGVTIRSLANLNPNTVTQSQDINLLDNGSFEDNSNSVPTSWTLFEWNTAANVVDNTDSNHGEWSMKFVSAGAGGGHVTSNAFISVAASQVVYVDFFIKSSVADVRNIVQILWYDENQVALGSPSTSVYDDSATNPTAWTLKSSSTTAPTGAKFLKLKVVGADSSDATAGTVRYDGVRITIDQLSLNTDNVIAGDNTFNGQNINLFSTGDVKLTLKAVADPTWVLMDDKSIGNAASGATGRANDDTSALFSLLWTNIIDTWAPVSTGRGASAAADFAANKTLTLPLTLGRALGAAGAGATLTSRALGENLGVETHALSTAELPAHDHGAEANHVHVQQIDTAGGGAQTLANMHGGDGGGTSDGSGLSGGISDEVDIPTTAAGGHTHTSVGSNTAHINMQPTSFFNVMVKL